MDMVWGGGLHESYTDRTARRRGHLPPGEGPLPRSTRAARSRAAWYAELIGRKFPIHRSASLPVLSSSVPFSLARASRNRLARSPGHHDSRSANSVATTHWLLGQTPRRHDPQSRPIAKRGASTAAAERLLPGCLPGRRKSSSHAPSAHRRARIRRVSKPIQNTVWKRSKPSGPDRPNKTQASAAR